MNTANKIMYHGYIIERTTISFYYDNKYKGDKTFYSITQEKDGNVLFFRSARFDSFKTAEQAKRAIKDKRIFCCAAITAYKLITTRSK